MVDAEYTEDDWAAAIGHQPLDSLEGEQILLLHRQWMWANQQRDRFDELLPGAPRPFDDEAFLASKCFSAMYLWYALLWSVIEGFADRSIEVRGRLAEDISEVGQGLRRCRNAVFHVPGQYYDPRLFAPMDDPESAARIRRISTGFGRLFLEHMGRT